MGTGPKLSNGAGTGGVSALARNCDFAKKFGIPPAWDSPEVVEVDFASNEKPGAELEAGGNKLVTVGRDSTSTVFSSVLGGTTGATGAGFANENGKAMMGGSLAVVRSPAGTGVWKAHIRYNKRR